LASREFISVQLKKFFEDEGQKCVLIKTVGIAFSVISRLKDIITWFQFEACFKLLGVWGVKTITLELGE